MTFNLETFIGDQTIEFWIAWSSILFGIVIIMGKLVIAYINHLRKHSADEASASEKIDTLDEKIIQKLDLLDEKLSAGNERISTIHDTTNETRFAIYASLNNKIQRTKDLDDIELDDDEVEIFEIDGKQMTRDQAKRLLFGNKRKKRRIDEF